MEKWESWDDQNWNGYVSGMIQRQPSWAEVVRRKRPTIKSVSSIKKCEPKEVRFRGEGNAGQVRRWSDSARKQMHNTAKKKYETSLSGSDPAPPELVNQVFQFMAKTRRKYGIPDLENGETSVCI